MCTTLLARKQLTALEKSLDASQTWDKKAKPGEAVDCASDHGSSDDVLDDGDEAIMDERHLISFPPSPQIAS